MLLFRTRYQQGAAVRQAIDTEDDEKYLLSDSASREVEEQKQAFKYKHSAGETHDYAFLFPDLPKRPLGK